MREPTRCFRPKDAELEGWSVRARMFLNAFEAADGLLCKMVSDDPLVTLTPQESRYLIDEVLRDA